MTLYVSAFVGSTKDGWLSSMYVTAANIGAHQTGQSSLVYRLRDASKVRGQVTRLLEDLGWILDEIMIELSSPSDNSEDVGSLLFWPEDNAPTELQHLYGETVSILDCLYETSMLIRQPAQTDFTAASRKGFKSHYGPYDKAHVRGMHPKTDEQTVDRLGYAITQRRNYLDYRSRHHAKLKKGIEPLSTVDDLSDTVATDFITSAKDDGDMESQSIITSTSYASSFVEGHGKATVPPPPRDAIIGKPFECPYCWFLINVKNRQSWTRHVLKDIKPYICTFADCGTPNKLYESRNTWFAHEMDNHNIENRRCPLCAQPLDTSNYERHVARHLEEVSVFALPGIEEDEEDLHHNFDYSDRSPLDRSDRDMSPPPERITNRPTLPSSPNYSDASPLDRDPDLPSPPAARRVSLESLRRPELTHLPSME